jgi:DNA polymerase III subunit epsilon
MIKDEKARCSAHEEAVAWAQDLLNRNDWVILAAATTGLYRAAEIVELAVIDSRGEMLFETLIRPQRMIPAEAVAIHGITDDMVRHSPSFPQIAPALFRALEHRRIIGYNVAFEARLLRQCVERHGLLFDIGSTECLMRFYAKFWGERQASARGFRSQKLTNACQQQGIAWETHRAGPKCQAELTLLFSMVRSAQAACLQEGLLLQRFSHWVYDAGHLRSA